MDFRAEHVRRAIQDFDFSRLFIEELGWDNPPGPQSVEVEDLFYDLEAVAEKSGLVAYVHRAAEVPSRAVRMKIERQLTKAVYEHLLVFTDADQTIQVWQWVRRQRGQTPRYREHVFHQAQSGEPLVQKLQPLAFSFDEEPATADVTGRARKAFDVDRITRRFYDKFNAEHKAFQKFLRAAISLEKDREVYASVMLDRLMFVYFIQKKGFLDDDYDYLRTRLKQVQRLRGQGRFLSFYRHFLRRFFHEGLGQPKIDRDPELIALIGKVPYLNGGIFDPHELERRYPEIQVDDLAFVRLFDFFDAYDWHLDERPLRNDREINPDVLGYIFEKYVNQKQMGAYYTKEDITGYIARNTIIPRLFNMARKECNIAFQPDSALWRLLSENPDRYIYPSVRKGVDLPLPDEINAGRDDVSLRGGWNSPADAAYAHPTETWREHVARRRRHDDIWEKLVDGEFNQIDDLITLNLDILQFAQDLIRYCEGPELLRAFWKAIRGISVLDPACGSGAFLFAALNVLEPLYDACLERMEAFVDELDRSDGRRGTPKFSDFREYLDEVSSHPNRRYYILKSIVIGNLYGVDIMEEAVEICKLRLFLKLAAQVDTVDELEPLPDIDFNIRPGNALVGFTSLDEVRHAMTIMPDGQFRQVFPDDQAILDRIEEEAEIANAAYNQFQRQQTLLGGEVTAADKANLRRRLESLSDGLDRHLASEYGINIDKSDAYDAWRASHEPFHWFAEFYGIMSQGGFEVVIGNPPYVQWRRITDYTIRGYQTEKCPDIYAACVERSMLLARDSARYGMILPISFQFSRDFEQARAVVRSHAEEIWTSTFSRNPAALFSAGLGVRSTIVITRVSQQGKPRIFTTRLNRWVEEFRPLLFQSLEYARLSPHLQQSGWPRIGSRRIGFLFQELVAQGKTMSGSVRPRRHPNPKMLRFKTTALYYISAFVHDPPSYNQTGQPIEHTDIGSLRFKSEEIQEVALVLALGKIALMWWTATGDDFHVTASGLGNTPVAYDSVTENIRTELQVLSRETQEAMKENVIYTRYAGKWMGNYDIKRVRHLTDKADRLVLDSLGLGDYWDDLELEYVRFLKMTGERPGTTRTVPDFTKLA